MRDREPRPRRIIVMSPDATPATSRRTRATKQVSQRVTADEEAGDSVEEILIVEERFEVEDPVEDVVTELAEAVRLIKASEADRESDCSDCDDDGECPPVTT